MEFLEGTPTYLKLMCEYYLQCVTRHMMQSGDQLMGDYDAYEESTKNRSHKEIIEETPNGS